MNRSIVITAVAVLLVASFAAAQGPRFAPTDTEVAMRGRHGLAAAQSEAARPMRGAPAAQAARPATTRPLRGANVDSGLSAELQGVVAAAFGLTQDELHALKQDGASIAGIAAERGVDLASIEAAYLAARDVAIDRLLAEGTIHAFQAEQMRARGADAFASLSAREGLAEGQNVTGERLHAQRQAPDQPTGGFGRAAGRRGRW